MIDVVHEAAGKIAKRPRTYREKARKDYLSLSKQRKPRKDQIRKALRKQLQYVGRKINLEHKLRVLIVPIWNMLSWDENEALFEAS
jgi:hypothetical protein